MFLPKYIQMIPNISKQISKRGVLTNQGMPQDYGLPSLNRSRHVLDILGLGARGTAATFHRETESLSVLRAVRRPPAIVLDQVVLT